VIDSRIADWRIGLVDTIADNASSGLVVSAGRLVRADAHDLRLVGMAFYRNGELVDTGAGAAVLGNPARCVAWLANKLSEFGTRLRAGELVLAGALHKAVAVEPGDVFRAEFNHLGAVTTRFHG
jgi:2-keto-4-pentenoate hydratase